MATFEFGLWNAWLLSLPFFVLVVCMVGMKKSIVRRMSDMTGYSIKEKLVTVSASLAPYPFMVATVWVPLTPILPVLCLGLLVYIVGIVLFAASLKVIIRTPSDEPFTAGPYRFSRNPMYVSATTVFIGICLATANLVLAGYLAIAVLLQHFMILAEERTCRLKYGVSFDHYLKRVPRYFIVV